MAAERRYASLVSFQTIVECLKFAATGDLPPNTKGGAFVYDPMLVKSDTVKAQIRLRFRNTHGVRMSCVRNLQVSKKRGGGLTMKTLEGILGVDDLNTDPDRRASISTKCAELGEEMSQLLGASSAILESVLFCHQEESNWPLSEPAMLKKRFDEIFQVTRYTKALDNLKTLRKQRLQDARVDEAELQALQQEKERAESVSFNLIQTQRTIRSLQASRESKTIQLDSLDEQIAKKTAQNKVLYDSAVQCRETIAHAALLEERLTVYRENRESLLQNTTLLETEENQLRAEIAAYPEELQTKQLRIDTLHTELSEMKQACKQADDEYEQLLRRQGEYSAAQKSLQHLTRSASEEVHGIAQRYDLETPDDTQNIDHFRSQIQSQLETRFRTLDAEESREESALRQREHELEDVWQQKRNRFRELQAQHQQQIENLDRFEKRIAQYEQEIDVDENDDRSELLEALRSRKQSLSSQLNQPETSKQREILADRLRSLEHSRDTINRSLMSFIQDMEQRAVMQQQERTEGQMAKTFEAQIARLHSDAQNILGHSPHVAADIAAEAARLVVEKEQALKTVQASEQEQQRQYQHSSATLELQNSRISECDVLLKEAQKKCSLNFASLTEELQGAREEVQIAQDSLSILEHAAGFFERILEQGLERHVCIGCNRGLPDSAMPAFESHARASMQRSTPERIQGLRDDLAGWKSQVNKLEEELKVHEEIQRLEAEHTRLQTRQKQLDEETRNSRHLLSTLTREAQSAQVSLDTVREFAAEASRAREHQHNLDTLRAELETMRTTLSSDTNQQRSAKQMRDELEKISQEIRETSQHQDTLRKEQDRLRIALTSVEQELYTVEISIVEAQRKNLAKEEARRRRAEVQSDLDQVRERIQALESEMETESSAISEARHALDQFRSQQQTSQETRMQAKQQRRDDLYSVCEWQKKLEAAKSSLPSASEDLSSEFADAQSRRSERKASRERMEAEWNTLTMELRDAKAIETQLKDNLRIRELNREEQRMTRELDSIQLQEAQAKHTDFMAQYDEARREENEWNGEAAHLRGELLGIESEQKRRENELATDYKDVHARYIKQLIHIKVASMANQDLQTYSGALQQAILQFHAIKMEEVNQTLDYLWKKTYQGTDIDTILIRSDTDGKLNANGLRSYQYRVCMVKDGVELDMRGRCSAGQKVLACILVRLALADSFGVDCGFLALDEPTTNLDRENVEALAASLVDLIAERQHQRNFQLIVITHDEDFLSRLCQSDALTEYWRVSRDQELVRCILSR
ncbi:DNA repair protein rad50 [Malassezia yamatoensis]|uniref:DNA repair protein RAD50 n=1 Tax=Malassezia yamatoensis TaxID=253288 RepID=A0AAJ6CIA1_9BASI|nr:DNA repair protein rad50 [Malassezia yamatoensis]